MNLILAAAAAAETATNTTLRLSNLPLIERFERATGVPHEVAVWSVNILAALIIFFIGYLIAGIMRGVVRKLFARRNIDATVGGFVGNLVHALLMTFVIITALSQLGNLCRRHRRGRPRHRPRVARRAFEFCGRLSHRGIPPLPGR